MSCMYHFRRHLMLIVPLLVTLSLITWLQWWWPTLSRVKAHLPLVVNNRESVMCWVNWCLDSAAVLLPEALASNDSPAQCSDMCACLHRSRLRTLMLHLHWLSVDFPWVKCSSVSCERRATPRRNGQGYWQFTPCCLHSWFLVPVLLQLPLPLGPGAGLGEFIPSLYCNPPDALGYSSQNPIFHFQKEEE